MDTSGAVLIWRVLILQTAGQVRSETGRILAAISNIHQVVKSSESHRDILRHQKECVQAWAVVHVRHAGDPAASADAQITADCEIWEIWKQQLQQTQLRGAPVDDVSRVKSRVRVCILHFSSVLWDHTSRAVVQAFNLLSFCFLQLRTKLYNKPES